MKAHLIRIAVVVLAVVGSQPATPIAARPNDPDSTLVTLLRQPDHTVARNYVDPLDELCPACVSELVTDQPIPWRSTETLSSLRTVVDAATTAGQYTSEMLIAAMNAQGGLWMVRSAFVGACVALDMKNSPAKLLAGNAPRNALETPHLVYCW